MELNSRIIRHEKSFLMKEVFIKKNWEEGEILYYIHFIGENAVRQIEIYPDTVILTSLDKPIVKDTMLYDKNLSDLDLDLIDYITQGEFDSIWKKYS